MAAWPGLVGSQKKTSESHFLGNEQSVGWRSGVGPRTLSLAWNKPPPFVGIRSFMQKLCAVELHQVTWLTQETSRRKRALVMAKMSACLFPVPLRTDEESHSFRVRTWDFLLRPCWWLRSDPAVNAGHPWDAANRD